MNIRSLSQIVGQIREHATESDFEDRFPEREFELVSKAGLLQMPLKENPYRFEQFQAQPLLEVLKLIGSASLPVGRIYEGHINALQLIGLFGTQTQKDNYYNEVFNDQLLFGVWNTQAADGVVLRDLGSGKYKLEGSKTFCSGGGWIQRPLITAELVSGSLKKGWQMCIIPSSQVKRIVADNSFWKPLGMRASASYKMDFTGIVLDQKDLLGIPNAYYQEPWFSGGAVRFAAVQLGGVTAILEETHKFLRELNRTDDPFQRARVAEMAYLIETGNLWVSSAGARNDAWKSTEANHSGLIGYINMTRTIINELCLRCMQLSERCVGARGLIRPNPLERLHRDLTTYLKQPFPDAVLTSIGGYVLGEKDISKLWQ